jgi:hypothetical protein
MVCFVAVRCLTMMNKEALHHVIKCNTALFIEWGHIQGLKITTTKRDCDRSMLL